jgi:glycosyltransferase involved in cell wall biosynthesis
MARIDKPLVSVVMTVLDADETFFRQSLESVLRQTYEQLEVVIVEDPSPRSVGPLVAARGDTRVRYFRNGIRTSHREQRNQSLAEARGALIAIIDADDVWRPEKLMTQVDFFRSNPDVGVIGACVAAIDGASRLCGHRSYPLHHDGIVKAMRRFNPLSHPTVLFEKQVVVEHGGYQQSGPCHDYELWCRLARQGVRFANCPQALVNYRLHEGQIKTTQLRRSLRNTIAIKEKYWAHQFTAYDRAWLYLEKCLLRLPPTVVLQSAKWFRYYSLSSLFRKSLLRRDLVAGK